MSSTPLTALTSLDRPKLVAKTQLTDDALARTARFIAAKYSYDLDFLADQTPLWYRYFAGFDICSEAQSKDLRFKTLDECVSLEDIERIVAEYGSRPLSVTEEPIPSWESIRAKSPAFDAEKLARERDANALQFSQLVRRFIIPGLILWFLIIRYHAPIWHVLRPFFGGR